MERNNEYFSLSPGQDNFQPSGISEMTIPDDAMAALDILDWSDFALSPDQSDLMENFSDMELNQFGQPSPAQESQPLVEQYDILQRERRYGDQEYQMVVDPATVQPTDNRTGVINEGQTVPGTDLGTGPSADASPSSDDPFSSVGEGDFRIISSFMKSRVLGEKVNGQGGCVLFHKCPGQTVVEPPVRDGQTRLQIPTMVTRETENETVQEEFNWSTASQERYTKRILDNLGGGLGLAADGCGNLYAKRCCLAKVYWTSTEGTDDVAIELQRNELTQIFQRKAFEERYKKEIEGLVPDDEVRRPAIRFVIGQKWNVTSEPFNTKLLTVRVEPLRPNMMVEWHKWNSKNHSLYDSYHSSLFLISNPGEANNPPAL